MSQRKRGYLINMHKKIKVGKKVIWVELTKTNFKEYYIDGGKWWLSFQLRRTMFDFMVVDKYLGDDYFDEWLDLTLKDVDEVEKRD